MPKKIHLKPFFATPIFNTAFGRASFEPSFPQKPPLGIIDLYNLYEPSKFNKRPITIKI